MLPFVVEFADDLPDLPVFAESEQAARDLGREEAGAENGFDAPVPAMTVRAGEVYAGSVKVDVYLASPDRADQLIRDAVPATFLTNSMRLGAGEIVCDADDQGPAVYSVQVPVELALGDSEEPEVRLSDAKGLIESYL